MPRILLSLNLCRSGRTTSQIIGMLHLIFGSHLLCKLHGMLLLMWTLFPSTKNDNLPQKPVLNSKLLPSANLWVCLRSHLLISPFHFKTTNNSPVFDYHRLRDHRSEESTGLVWSSNAISQQLLARVYNPPYIFLLSEFFELFVPPRNN